MNNKQNVTIIKKYSNRRLYNTNSSAYINLEDLYQMIREGEDFIVQESSTGEDITNIILTQIIMEQESKGYNLLNKKFLRGIIGFYDNSMGSILPHYLANAIEIFIQNQEQFKAFITDHYFKQNLDKLSPLNMFDELMRSNLKLFDIFSAHKEKKE